jgi:hypothetical protein
MSSGNPRNRTFRQNTCVLLSVLAMVAQESLMTRSAFPRNYNNPARAQPPKTQSVELTNTEGATRTEVRGTEDEGADTWSSFWRRNAQYKKRDDAFTETVQKLSEDELKSLYFLSFLLAANQETAE